MSSLGRIVVLGFFASCGVGVAVCLALTDEAGPESQDLSAVRGTQPALVDTAQDEPAEPASTGVSDLDREDAEQQPSARPVAASVVPEGGADSNPARMPPAVPRWADRSFVNRDTARPLLRIRAPQAMIPSKAPQLPPPDQSPNHTPNHSPDLAPRRDPIVVAQEPSVPVSTMMQLIDRVIDRSSEQVTQVAPPKPTPLPPPVRPPAQPPSDPPSPVAEQPTVPPAPAPSTKRLVNEGDDQLTLHLKDTDIREVLDLLSQGSGHNIMATQSVKGTVTATLQNVPFETALRAILKSTGYVAHLDGDIIYVGTPEELKTEPDKIERVATRIYRPNYTRASDLQALITPLLTPEVGTVSVTTPADSGIPSDGASAGGDMYANAEVLLVRDYESVLRQIDQVFEDVDIRPLQVAIEAMILGVKLNDSNRLGVNFELLRDRNDVRIISGDPLGSLAQLNVTDGGLKVGFLNGNVSVFIDALETIGDTDVIATPRLLVLNKQRAEILIGAELGYVSSTVTETATTQTVEFLEVGTALRLRPFISSDGLIRMEIHPELSTGEVRVEGGFTLPDKEVTQVTTNVMARDGSTVIIGGLIREDLSSSATQIPLLGSLPGVGVLFRQKKESLNRREILVLITPHIIYEPEIGIEGDQGAMEFHHRHAIEFENMSPLGKRRVSHTYLIKAQRAWAGGDARHALKYANLAIHYNTKNRAAIDLRADIWAGNRLGDHTAGAPYVKLSEPDQLLDGQSVHPWLLDRLDPAAPTMQRPLHPMDPGQPGPRVDIVTPERH